MGEMLRKVLEGAGHRLQSQVTTYLPPILAAAVILAVAFAAATALRWLIYRIFKGLAIDRFLRRSGVAYVLDPSGRLRATRIAAETAYWGILTGGALNGISVFDTDLTSRTVQSFFVLFPKLLLAAAILVAGAWLSHYLGRSAVVWAAGEALPAPRRIGALVRVVLMFAAVVVAADHLDFARGVFLAAFIIVCGGMILTASLAAGIGAAGEVRRLFEQSRNGEERDAEPVGWNHL